MGRRAGSRGERGGTLPGRHEELVTSDWPVPADATDTHTLRMFAPCVTQVVNEAELRRCLGLRAHAQGGDGDPEELVGLSLACWRPLPQGLDEFWPGQNLHLLPLSFLPTCHSGTPWCLLPRERIKQGEKNNLT